MYPESLDHIVLLVSRVVVENFTIDRVILSHSAIVRASPWSLVVVIFSFCNSFIFSDFKHLAAGTASAIKKAKFESGIGHSTEKPAKAIAMPCRKGALMVGLSAEGLLSIACID